MFSTESIFCSFPTFKKNSKYMAENRICSAPRVSFVPFLLFSLFALNQFSENVVPVPVMDPQLTEPEFSAMCPLIESDNSPITVGCVYKFDHYSDLPSTLTGCELTKNPATGKRANAHLFYLTLFHYSFMSALVFSFKAPNWTVVSGEHHGLTNN